MSKFMQIALLSSIAGSTMFAATAPARATDTKEAIKACSNNPSCSMYWGKENGDITIRVDGSNTIITCPKKNGTCAATIKHPKLPDHGSTNLSVSTNGNHNKPGGTGGTGGVDKGSVTAGAPTSMSRGSSGGTVQ